MTLTKELKKEIELFIGNRTKIHYPSFVNYTVHRSHEIIKDNTQAGHTKRKRLKNKMHSYLDKLIHKNLEKRNKPLKKE